MAWVEKRLGDVCRLINGRAYKKHEMLPVGPYPLLRVGNFFTNRSWYYSDMELHPDKYCDDGDLLYAWSASFGPRIWDGGKVIYHYHIWKIEIDKELVDKNYLYYLLDWDKELIKSEQGAGTTMVHVTKGSMEKRLLPFPCLDEQKRIVAILDQTFADLEQVRAKTEQNLKNARELFDSYLQQVFSQRGEGWVEKSISKLGLVQTGNTPKTSVKENFGEFIPFIKPAHFLDGGHIALHHPGLSEQGKEQSRVVPKNSVAMVCIGATIGKCGFVEEEITCNQQINTLTPSDEIHHRFAYYQMLTKSFQKKVIYLSGQATLPIINKSKWSSLPLRFPKKEEQLAIIKKLDSLKVETQELEGNYQDKLTALDELKKSILQKAFSGELTAKAE